MIKLSDWLQIWNKILPKKFQFPWSPRNDKLPFPDSLNPRGLKIAGELASLIIINQQAILDMEYSAVPSHEINFCCLTNLAFCSWLGPTIISFLWKALLAPQKGSEITKILVHLILANFLVSQRPKQDRENRDGLPGCSKAWRLKSWGSEATPSATHSFRRSYKISHPPFIIGVLRCFA